MAPADTATTPAAPRTAARIAGAAGAFAFVAGAAALAGWTLYLPRLTDWFNSGINMKANAAFAAAVAGAALLLSILAPTARPAVRLLALFVVLVASLTLFEIATGLDLGIDMLIAYEAPGAAATASPGRMGVPASTSFLIIGLALIYGSLPSRRGRLAIPLLGLAVVAITSLSLTGYLFNALSLFMLPGLTGIAAQTAVMLLALGLGLVASVPDLPPMRTLLEDSGAGLLARRALPWIILLPLVLGWLRVRGQEASLYDPGMGHALIAYIQILLMSGLLVWAVNAVGAREKALEAARDDLRDSESRFRDLADHISQLAWMTDGDGSIFWYNQRWFDYTGATLDAMKGWGWMSVHHPDHLDRVVTRFKAAVAAGSPWEDTFPLRGADGAYRWFLSRAQPVRDASGRIIRWFGTNTDINAQRDAEESLARHRAELEQTLERRTAELKDSLHRLSASERLAALGNLAAGVGHDIANMVLPIRARLEPLEETCTSPESRDDLASIHKALDHLTNLSAGLRLMALDPSRESRSTDGADLARWWLQAQGVLRAVLPRRVRLDGFIPPGLAVLISPQRLTQVIFNLVQNAGEAIGAQADGLVTITVEPAPSPDPNPAHSILLRVADNGPGMTPDVLRRCFEPYFSTKGRAIATGMGLGMVRGMVESAGGAVTVASEPGRGATFTLTLPLARGHDATSALGSASISIADSRTAALAQMILESLRMKADASVPLPGQAAPNSDLWVAHSPSWSAILAFLADHPARRMVLLGEPADGAEPHADDRWSHIRERITRGPFPLPPSLLRNLLAQAAQAPPPHQTSAQAEAPRRA